MNSLPRRLRKARLQVGDTTLCLAGGYLLGRSSAKQPSALSRTDPVKPYIVVIVISTVPGHHIEYGLGPGASALKAKLPSIELRKGWRHLCLLS